MTAYTPGAGRKKPMNMLENPIYPDIKKGPIRFKWSRKYWQADPGAVMRDTEPYTQFVEQAVLAQSRDYNQNIYGKSSHRDIVNAEFRPPLTNYYEDEGPLNRLPVKLQAIIPRMNPGTAGHDGGTSSYTSRNQRPSDIEGSLTDRLKTAGVRPTFYAPLDVPMDNSVLPDLETKLPPISLHAGWNFPVYLPPSIPEDYETPNKPPTIPIDPGFTTQVRIDGESGLENYKAFNNRPIVSATAGINTPFETRIDFDLPEYDLNRPLVSADAGMNTPFQIDAEIGTINLEEKNDRVPLQVLNPGSETGYKERNNNEYDTERHIQINRPSYSYTVPSEYRYQEQNYLTNKPQMRARLEPELSYGQLSQSGGAMPKKYIEQPTVRLRNRK